MSPEITAIIWMAATPIVLAIVFCIVDSAKYAPPSPKCCECGKTLHFWDRSRMCSQRHDKCQQEVLTRMMADDSMRTFVEREIFEWKNR